MDLSLLIRFHNRHLRQGPGSDELTRKALELTRLKGKENIQIADLGCGSGSSSLILAQELQGKLTAVDLFDDFLLSLKERSKKIVANCDIQTSCRSMDDLNFEKESLDLIWSEGAIYNIGFKKGLRYWKDFLKAGGFIAVSEISWLSKKRPDKINDYWNSNYSEIDLVSSKIKVLEELGYRPIGHFIIPPEVWLEEYYKPIERDFQAFLESETDKSAAEELISGEQKEIQLYKQFKDFYSYGFYIAQKI